MLAAYGYAGVKNMTVGQRRDALTAAADSLGWRVIVQRLNVLYIYNKNRHPETAALFRQDRDFASRQLRRQFR